MKILPVLLMCVVSVSLAFGESRKATTGLTSRLDLPAAEFTTGGPAVEPARSFPATFEFTNSSSAPVKVALGEPASSLTKIAFRLLDGSGDVLWTSEEPLAEGAGPVATLAVGQSWKRTVQIPLFLEDGQLEIGRYSVEAYVPGAPEYSSTASFQMTYNVVPTSSVMPSVLSSRKWGVSNTLTVADSRVVVGLRRGDNVRLSGVVRATFSLANQTAGNIAFSFPDSGSSQRKIGFSLLDEEGHVIWKSDSDLISLPVVVESTLLAGKTWTRTLDIPLHVDGTALEEGFYTIVGQVEGSPLYRSATTIRVVNRAR